MSRYLVTGSAGFIGSKVAEFLLDDGHEVVGVDNLNDAYDVRLKEWRHERLAERDNFTFHAVDIGDTDEVTEVFEGPRFDAIVNLAARAGVRQSVRTPHVYVQTNVVGALNLLRSAVETGVPTYLLASTSSLYGLKSKPPFREDANTDYPLSPYAASKKGAETMAHSFHHLFGINVAIVRYFTVYGPAGRPDMSLFRFVQWISEGRPVRLRGDGSQSRDFTYVDDIAAGTIASLGIEGFEIFNLGAHREVVLMDAIRLIEDATGSKAQIETEPVDPADMPATLADVTKATDHLGWRAQVGIEEGIKRLVDWYQDNRDWARHVTTTD